MQKNTENRQQFPVSAPEADGDEIDLLGLFRTLWRGRFLIAFCTFCAILAGGYYAYVVAVPIYSATTQMALQFRTQNVTNIESVLAGVSDDYYSINTEMEFVQSHELVSRLVDRLGFVSDPEFNASLRPDESTALSRSVATLRSTVRDLLLPPRPVTTEAGEITEDTIRNGVIETVRRTISAQPSQDSYVFDITATTLSPSKSVLIANTLAQLFRDDQISVKVEATENAATWLSGRVSELQTELETRQRAITELRTQSALVSPEALTALNVRSVELQGRLQTAVTELGRVAAVNEAMVAAISSDNAAKVAAASDVQLEAIATAILRGDATGQMRFDRRYQQLLAQSEGEQTRVSSVVADLQVEAEQIGRQFQDQSAKLLDLQQLERETEATRVLYETFLTRLKETTVQEGVHQADSRIYSAAITGQLVAPRKSRIVALSMILGLMVGAGIILVREWMQNTFRTGDDLQKFTGYTVLGQIPKIPAKGRPETISYLVSKPTSAAAEAVRNLRTSILLSDLDNPPKVIMVTSSVPGEGKTTQAIALSQNLAGLGKKVILLEGDIRRRTFTAYFKDSQQKAGILSVLSGKTQLAEAVYTHPTMKIDILMGEKSDINAADVFSSDKFQDLITLMRGTYDYIIIDTPPVLVVPDARVIGQMADSIIYVVNWDRTTKTQVFDGIQQFESVGLRINGLVLSQIDAKGMKRYGYGDKYGAYSRYGQGYYEA